jgi:hypothetical protein
MNDLSVYCWHDFDYTRYSLSKTQVNQLVNSLVQIEANREESYLIATNCINRNNLYIELLKGFNYEYKEISNFRTKKSQGIFMCREGNCAMEFTRSWNLLNHVRSHRGLRPYSCQICKHQFTQKGNLKKHIKTHLLPSVENRKRFKCRHCNRMYTERYNFRVSPHFSNQVFPSWL